jgi:hypothetical protein
MDIKQPYYRKDYIGETINGYKDDGTPFSVFVPPRENVFSKPSTEYAIVLGNGPTKNYKDTQYLLKTNASKVSQGYKFVYACNKAVNDTEIYDYYILRSRIFLSNIPSERLDSIYLPTNIFLDYKDRCNLIPFRSYYDAGTSAAHLAAFDGHKKVFLFGFDGDMGAGYQSVYDGQLPYISDHREVDFTKTFKYLYEIALAYRDVNFYRLKIDGQKAPDYLLSLPNFKDCNVREIVLAGDF